MNAKLHPTNQAWVGQLGNVRPHKYSQIHTPFFDGWKVSKNVQAFFVHAVPSHWRWIYICIYIYNCICIYIYNCICIRNGGIQSNSGYPSIAVARGHNVSKQYGLDVVMSWIELRGTTVESLPSPVYYKILGLLDTQQITNPFQGFKCLGIIGRETKPQPHQR